MRGKILGWGPKIARFSLPSFFLVIMVDHGFRILCASEQSCSPKEAQPPAQTCRNPASRTIAMA
jgi:hypothetical protein